MSTPLHVYEIFIKASPANVWEALTEREFTERYFHGTRFESTWEEGASFRNILSDDRDAVDGVVEVFDPPRRLVLTWHVLYDTALAEEPPGRVEWQLQPANDDGSATRVTLRHGDLGMSPLTWAHVRLGWVEILDGMKTLLETGEPLPSVNTTDPDQPNEAAEIAGQWHRRQAIDANNSVWELLDDRKHSPAEADDLLGRAYAAAYHWARATSTGHANAARASWLLSRCHAVLGHGDLALHHAERTAHAVADGGLVDFDLAYAHEARARALACLGRLDEAKTEFDTAASIEINDTEDRNIFEGDLNAGPWFELAPR